MNRENFEWTDREGNLRVSRNQLTEMKHQELQSHVRRCPKDMRRCADCWLLYWNIGTDAWDDIMREMGA